MLNLTADAKDILALLGGIVVFNALLNLVVYGLVTSFTFDLSTWSIPLGKYRLSFAGKQLWLERKTSEGVVIDELSSEALFDRMTNRA